MELNTKQKVCIIIAIFSLGVGSGYFSKPTKIEERIVEVVKEDTKKQEQKEKIVYKERIVYKDGTIKEIEKTEDKSNTSESSSKESSKSSEKVVKNDIGLNLSLLAIRPINSVQSATTEYGLHVSKRIISNITVGAYADTEKRIGVSVGLSF